MLAAFFAAALVSAPTPPDQMVRKVLTEVCLPFAGGATDRAAAEGLGFTVASENGAAVEMVSSDRSQAFLLSLAGDEDAEDGEDTRTCVLQARTMLFDVANRAIRGPLEEAGFVSEATQPANRPVWTRQGVTVSLRQNEGRATVMRVTYSSLEAAGS